MREAAADRETTTACPECDHWDVYLRTGKDDPEIKGSWYCRNCEQPIDEPIRREREGHTDRVGRLSAVGKALEQADPDSDWDDLRADGGHDRLDHPALARHLDELDRILPAHHRRLYAAVEWALEYPTEFSTDRDLIRSALRALETESDDVEVLYHARSALQALVVLDAEVEDGGERDRKQPVVTDGGQVEYQPVGLDDLAVGDRVRVQYLDTADRAERSVLEGAVAEIRASEHDERAVEQVLVDADGTRYRITFGGSISRCDEDREVSVGFFARLDRVREVATDGGHPAKAELEHAVRMLVDEYRGELDDRDLAVVLDAVRMELDHGNYTPARQPRADGGSVAVEMTDEHDRCPECGLVVSGIRTEGASTHVIEPCGHPADLDVRRAVAERALPDEGVDLAARVVAHLETLYLAADGRLAWTADDRERLAADLVAFRAAFGIEPQTPADAVRFEEEADT